MDISLKNVSAGYDKKHSVLHDIALDIPEGTSVGIIGPNGSGKTTLLRVLSGVLGYEGSVRLMSGGSTADDRGSADECVDAAVRGTGDDGTEISEIPQKCLARYISMLQQFTAAYFSYTVRDTVALGRYAHQKSRLGRLTAEDSRIIDEALALTGTDSIAASEISALSGGQLQRVYLARTIAQQTPVMLLDEPTNHLDFKYSAELTDYLIKRKDETYDIDGDSHRATLIAVFHDIMSAYEVCDTIVYMSDGRIVAVEKAKDGINAEILSDIYGIDVVQSMKRRMSILGGL